MNPTPDQLAARLNPTASTLPNPTSGLWRATGDSGNGGFTIFNSTTRQSTQINPDQFQAQYGIDFHSLPSYVPSDVYQAQGIYNTGYGWVKDPTGWNISAPQTNNPIAINTQPNATASPAALASAGAATQQQLAADQGKNVQSTTDANGNIISTNATPLANTPAPINTALQIRPGETIALYNARIAAMTPNLPAPGTTSSTGVTNTATAPITSTMLGSSSAPPFTQTPVTTPYNTAALYSTPPLTLTPEQQQQSTLSKNLEGLQTQEAGKAAYQTQQEDAAGVSTLTQAQNDLNSQLNTLKAEAAAIPQQIELDSTGRGISGGGIKPLQTAALRENSIKSLMVAAQIDATNGLLASAKDKANKAVNDVYAPIEAQIAAAKENLSTIANDPASSIAEKNQAQAQLDVKNQQAAAIAQQKSDTADIWTLATTAAANVGNFIVTPQYQTATQALTAIQSAPDKATALNIALQAGLAGGSKTGTWGTPYMLGGSYVQKNSLTGEVRQAVNPPNAPTTPDAFGTPTAADKSAVFTALGKDPAAAASVDSNRLQTDPQYFYWVKAQLGV